MLAPPCFLCFFFPLTGFSSNFESGGEEAALLALFIMEIDLTLICIYFHRHQADLESEGGCNLLRSWQICSKNRALELLQPALENSFFCPFDFYTTWAESQRNTTGINLEERKPLLLSAINSLCSLVYSPSC